MGIYSTKHEKSDLD